MGKTTLIYTFECNNRKNSEEMIITPGIDAMKEKIDQAEKGNIYQLSDGTKAKCFLYDTNGQEKYDSLSDSYYRDADGCLLVYDITNRESYDNIKNKYIAQIKEKCKNNIKVILIGNKSDLSFDREIERDEAGTFAVANHFQFQETSCVNNSNVVKAFQSIIEVTIFERKNETHFKKVETVKITTANHTKKETQMKKKKSSC